MNRIAKAFKVRAGEGRIVLLLVGLMVATSAGGSIGGNGIDALFISRFGVRFLPHMYIALGFITLVSSLIIAVLLARFARERLFVALPIVLAAALIGERLLVGTGVRWAYPLLWLGMNVKGALQALLTWGLAGFVCDTRQAKRLFPLFGAGNILGAVIGGLATPSLARIIHSENLLLVWAGSLLAAFAFGGALIGTKLRMIRAAPKKRARNRMGFVREMRRGYDVVRSSPFLRWTAGSAALFALLLYSIAFPFSKAASARFPDADQLASFFGVFQAVSTGIAFAVSLLVANRLFARFGIMKTVVAFPLIYLAGFGTLVAAGRFELIVGFRLVQMVWLQGVFGSAYQATYNVIPPDRKDQARAFIDGVPGQAGTVVAGVLLLVGEQALAPRTMSWIGFAAAALCVIVAAKVMRAYSGALVDALREGRPQMFIPEEEPFGGFQRDATAVAAAVAGVSNPDRTIRRVSAEILGQLSAPEATDALVRALKDRDPPVRIAALGALVHAESAEALLEVAARLYDPEPEVRAQAVDALRTLARYPAGVTREIRRLLQDPDSDVRARVAVSLSSFGEDAEARTAIRALSQGDVGDRLSLLDALGSLPITGSIDLIKEQAGNPAPKVRRAAARALGRVDDEVASSLLIALLSDSDHSVLEAASENVAMRGKSLLPRILEALNDPRTEIGALRALEIADLDLPAEKIRDYARDVSARAVRDIDKWQAARSTRDGDAMALLVDALRHRAMGHANKAIRAVGLLSDREAVSTALDNLRSPDPAQRANALETLEGVGHREIVAQLIPLWDPEAPMAVATDGWLRKLLHDDDPLLRACAVLAIAESQDAELRAEAVRVAQSDPDPNVKGAAVRITTEHPMDTLATLSTIERVLFLRRVPLFGGLSPDDLKDVAHIAGERTYSDGELLAEQGEPGDGLFVVVSGEVGVVIDYDSPQETEIARRTTGNYVGEMAVVTGGPRSASLVARGDVRVMFIDRLHFESLLRERPEVSLVLMKSLVDRIQEVNRFLPRELAVKLETARSRGTMAGERRVVTMLFCDVAGSTELAEQLDPEQWAEIMNRVFEILIAPVHRYEGTLARLMGDAILAFFGAPLAHEDDPLRAVRAGLDMVKEIQPLREELARERALELNVRVGINTGLVVVGEMGSDLRVEYTALGDAVNVAARMEQTAVPGTVQISEETQRLVAPFVELEDLGHTQVKGKREPVRAFRVIEVKAERGKTRGIEGLATPLVGRDEEIQTLYKSLAELGTGRGQIVCLVGEAGLGKSRLISELRAEWLERWGDEGLAQWAEARADSYDTSIPYAQFRQTIRHLCQVGAHASPAEARKRIAQVVEEEGVSGEEAARMRTIWQILLGVEEQPSGLEGEDLKRVVFETFTATVRRWGGKPSVFVADDLHWADRASVELILHLFSLSDELPILFLCASRPPAEVILQPARDEYADRLNEIELAPLSADEGKELVSGLIPIQHLPQQLRTLIVDKSAGNPFFLEEILRGLMEQGAIVRENGGWKVAVPVAEITIPDRLQGLLTARIDATEPAVKRTLQLAAVVGPTFHYRVLKSIVENPDDLGDHLDKLERAELIAEVAEIPELEFSFRHPLIHQAAYESILLRARKGLHLKVGEELENLFVGRESEEAPTLARHFEGAEDPRAVRYSSLAGDRAVRLHAHQEAITHYSTALAFAQGNPEGADFGHLFTSLGHSCELLGDFEEAIKAYETMRAFAQQAGDKKLELRAIGSMATVRATPNPMNDPAEARALLEQALEIARGIGDRESEAKTLWNLMLNLQFSEGSVEESIVYGEQALEIAQDLGAKEQVAFVLNDIAYPRFMIGQGDEAIEALVRAGELWRELDNQPMLVDSIVRHADLTLQRGNFEEGVRLAHEGFEIARRIGNEWGQGFALSNRGEALWSLGDLGRAMEDKSESVRLMVAGGLVIGGSSGRSDLAWFLAQLGALEEALETGRLAYSVAVEQFPMVRGWTLANLARVELLAGDRSRAEEHAEQAVSELPELGLFHFYGLIRALSARAEIALARGDPGGALKFIDELLIDHSRLGVRWRMPESLRLRAMALELEGRQDEAYETLVRAQSMAEGTSAKWALWQILASLADLESRRGNDEEAITHRARAREIVVELVESLTDPKYKESFKNRPDVAALVEFAPS